MQEGRRVPLDPWLTHGVLWLLLLGWPGLTSLVPTWPRRKNRGFLCAPWDKPGLQQSLTSLARHPHLPAVVICPSALAHRACLFHPPSNPTPLLPLSPGLVTALMARSVQLQEIGGSASGTPSPWAQGHSSPVGMVSLPSSPGREGSCCASCASRLGSPAQTQEAACPNVPYPTSHLSPPSLVRLSVSLQSYLSLALSAPSLFLSSCSSQFLSLFVSLPVSSHPPLFPLSVSLCICLSISVCLSVFLPVPHPSLPLIPLLVPSCLQLLLPHPAAPPTEPGE